MADRPRRDTSAPADYLYEIGGVPSAPPYRFSGVSAQIFPLRASLSRLRQFCDSYVNLFPNVAEFRPLDRFVELVVLEYPSIASVEQPAFATYGQTEVFFLVPVLWTDVASGRTRLAVITPYIFVDNPTSARIGRDMFGWPKEAAWHRRDASGSGSSSQLLAIDKETLTSSGVATNRLLEVDWLAPHGRFSFGRPNAERNLSLDLNGLLRVAERPLRIASRALSLWRRGLHGARTQWRTPTDLLNINLKQLPQLEPAGTACYQALTVTPLHVSRLNGLGLIGEGRQLLGDPSGGCVVRLFEDPTWPVVTQLGLAFERATPESSEPGARVAYQFRPTSPLWLSTDFEQQPSRIIASRGTPAAGGSMRAPLVSVLGSRSLLGATQRVSFRGARVQVFELAADAREHDRLCTSLDALDSDYAFASSTNGARARVLLSVASFEGMRSERISLAAWRETLVELYVPLRFRRRRASIDDWQACCFSFAGFATSNTLANTLHDVLGGNVMLASMSRGDETTAARGVDDQFQIFRLSTTVVPQFQLGERARIAPIIEVFGRPRSMVGDTPQPSQTAFAALPLLRLKQLPSAEDPRRASYQALIKTEWIDAKGVLLDQPASHYIRLYEYDSLRLLERLGLKTGTVEEPDHLGRPGRSLLHSPSAEAAYALHGEVTLHSEVLWERLAR